MAEKTNFVLKLYVTNKTTKIDTAVEKLRQVCEQELNGKYEISIINVLENPQLAEGDRVLATPTLIKELPDPVKRVIGDISNMDKVAVRLDLLRGGS